MLSLAITFYKHYFSCEFKYLLYHRLLQFNTVISQRLCLHFGVFIFLLWKSMLVFITVRLLHSNRCSFPKTWLLQTWDLMAQKPQEFKIEITTEAPSESGVISQAQSLFMVEHSSNWLWWIPLQILSWSQEGNSQSSLYVRRVGEFGGGRGDSAIFQLDSIFNMKTYCLFD